MTTVPKRVLDVGQCPPDHGAIRAMLVSLFGAEVDSALTTAQALQMLADRAYDLVLVNRLLDLDRSDGIDLIRQMQGRPKLSNIPVMLISNREDAQRRAVEAGAAHGFGKAGLHAPATEALLRPFLDTTAYA
ncbi:MAG: response regulator [Phycisphaerales bacterium]|nr:MAG: response regulator [Phycisphaerales bacterium]